MNLLYYNAINYMSESITKRNMPVQPLHGMDKHQYRTIIVTRYTPVYNSLIGL